MLSSLIFSSVSVCYNRCISKISMNLKISIIALLIIVLYVSFQIIKPEELPKGVQYEFLYVLQEVYFEEVENYPYKFLVIDPDFHELTQRELSNLFSNDGKELAYISIGEAEVYREYWNPEWNDFPPSFLGDENPEWEGNYKVEYWNEEWQEIVYEKLDQIIQTGFDGVYMDIIDAYEYFEEKGNIDARQKMMDFVIEISDYAKSQNPDFLIFPQNSPELVSFSEYLDAIDGVGKEDTWYLDSYRRDENEVGTELFYLDEVVNAGKPVLVVDYPTNDGKACDFVYNAENKGYLPFVGERDLRRIVYAPCR